MNTPQQSFAALIERKLVEFGITQKELERRSDITDTTWATWRAGRLPSRSLLVVIAMALQVPLSELKALIEQERAKRLPIGTVINSVEAAKAWATDHGAHHAQSVDASFGIGVNETGDHLPAQAEPRNQK